MLVQGVPRERRFRWKLKLLVLLVFGGINYAAGYAQGTTEAVVISRRELVEQLPETEYRDPGEFVTTTTGEPESYIPGMPGD